MARRGGGVDQRRGADPRKAPLVSDLGIGDPPKRTGAAEPLTAPGGGVPEALGPTRSRSEHASGGGRVAWCVRVYWSIWTSCRAPTVFLWIDDTSSRARLSSRNTTYLAALKSARRCLGLLCSRCNYDRGEEREHDLGNWVCDDCVEEGLGSCQRCGKDDLKPGTRSSEVVKSRACHQSCETSRHLTMQTLTFLATVRSATRPSARLVPPIASPAIHHAARVAHSGMRIGCATALRAAGPTVQCATNAGTCDQ